MFLRKSAPAAFIGTVSIVTVTIVTVSILLTTLAAAQSPPPPTPNQAPSTGKPDDLAKSLNLTPESKSLPIWSQPAPDAVTELSRVVRKFSPSVFIVGKSDAGTGTAWLLSKKNRLLATNAHVADLFSKGTGPMLAYQNGTTNVFTVVKTYYHPGVLRLSQGVLLRTTSSSTGNVYSRSPDVAILQLAEDGPELPDELPLASRDELYDLFAQPVAMLGYPSLDTNGALPAVGQKATASFREGVIDRVADFSNSAGGPPDRQQYLQHSMAGWFGFSGSPMFLPNGHVVALNNSGGTFSQNGLTATLTWGIRADCFVGTPQSQRLARQGEPASGGCLRRYPAVFPARSRTGKAPKSEQAPRRRPSRYAILPTSSCH